MDESETEGSGESDALTPGGIRIDTLQKESPRPKPRQEAARQALAEAILSTRDRCNEQWPRETGRPSPVQPRLFLGGRMLLQVQQENIYSLPEPSCSAACPSGWDSASERLLTDEVLAVGYEKGGVDLFVQRAQGQRIRIPVLEVDDKRIAAAKLYAKPSCLCFFPPIQGCQTWLLAVAFRGTPPLVCVLDITPLMLKIRTDKSARVGELAELARSRAVAYQFWPDASGRSGAKVAAYAKPAHRDFEVKHIARHLVNPPQPHPMLSHRQLFLVTLAQPLIAAEARSESEDRMYTPSPSMYLLACKARPAVLAFSTPKLEVGAVKVVPDLKSIFTDVYSPEPRREVIPSRMAGVWRAIDSMPVLQANTTPVEDPGLGAFTGSRPSASGAKPSADAPVVQDEFMEIFAVSAMDDVHICRIRHAANGTTLSRRFSLGISNGAWGGQCCIAWEPRDSARYHKFNARIERAVIDDSTTEPEYMRYKCQAARLAASWGNVIRVYQIPSDLRRPLPSADTQPRAGERPSMPDPMPSTPSAAASVTARRQSDMLWLAPDLVCTMLLDESEGVVSMHWICSDDGAHRLAVVTTHPDSDFKMAAMRLFNPDPSLSAAERLEEMVDLSFEVQPQASRLYTALRTLPAAQQDFVAKLNDRARAIAQQLSDADAGGYAYAAGELQSLPAVSDVQVDNVHCLADRKLVAVAWLPASPSAGEPDALVLRTALRMTWGGQKDILEMIAMNETADPVGRWELAVATIAEQYLLAWKQESSKQSSTQLGKRSSAGTSAKQTSARHLDRVIADALIGEGQLMDKFLGALQEAMLTLQALPEVAREELVNGRGLHDVCWEHRDNVKHPALATLYSRVSLAAAISLALSAHDPFRSDRAIAVYRKLASLGFRPTVVLTYHHLICKGVVAPLPPEFLHDVVVVALGDSDGMAAEEVSIRRDWIEHLLLHLHDPLSAPVMELQAVCKRGHMWTGLIHAATLAMDPLLPLQDILQHCCSDAPDSDRAGRQLLQYVQCCLQKRWYPAVAESRARLGLTTTLDDRPETEFLQKAQLLMVAFVFFTDRSFFMSQSDSESVRTAFETLKDPCPVLQVLLDIDFVGTTACLDSADIFQGFTDRIVLVEDISAVVRQRAGRNPERDPLLTCMLRLIQSSERLKSDQMLLRQMLVNSFVEMLFREGSTWHVRSLSRRRSHVRTASAMQLLDSPLPSLGTSSNSGVTAAPIGAVTRLPSAASMLSTPRPRLGACPADHLLAALEFLSSQVTRPPPMVLPYKFGVACISYLCKPWEPEDRPVQRRRLAALFVNNLDLEPALGGTRNVSKISALAKELEEAEMWHSAATLHDRIGMHTASVRCKVANCRALVDLCEAYDDATSLPLDEAHARRAQLSRTWSRLVDTPLSPAAPDDGAGTALHAFDDTDSVSLDMSGAVDGAEIQKLVREVDQNMQDMLGRLGRVLSTSRPSTDAHVEALQAVRENIQQLCRLEDDVRRLGSGDAVNSDSRLTDLLLRHMPTSDFQKVVEDEGWHQDHSTRRYLYTLLRHVFQPPSSRSDRESLSLETAAALSSNGQIQLLYVKLCCKFNESAVLPFLRSFRAISVDRMASFKAVVEEAGVHDAHAFILLRQGKRAEAQILALQHCRVALLDLRACLRTQLLPEALQQLQSGSTGALPGDPGQAGPLAHALVTPLRRVLLLLFSSAAEETPLWAATGGGSLPGESPKGASGSALPAAGGSSRDFSENSSARLVAFKMRSTMAAALQLTRRAKAAISDAVTIYLQPREDEKDLHDAAEGLQRDWEDLLLTILGELAVAGRCRTSSTCNGSAASSNQSVSTAEASMMDAFGAVWQQVLQRHVEDVLLKLITSAGGASVSYSDCTRGVLLRLKDATQEREDGVEVLRDAWRDLESRGDAARARGMLEVCEAVEDEDCAYDTASTFGSSAVRALRNHLNVQAKLSMVQSKALMALEAKRLTVLGDFQFVNVQPVLQQ